MPLAGGGVSTGGGGGGTNSTVTETRDHYVLAYDADVQILTLNEQSASQEIASPGLATAWIQYPAGYNGSVVASGLSRTGEAQQETLTNGGAGAVRGAKVFVGPITYTNPSPGGDGTHTASVGLSSRICAPTAPVTDFVALVDITGALLALSATEDLTNGWVQTTSPITNANFCTLYYTASHTHTIT